MAWHRVLMASADLDSAHKGAWRDRLGWVGGPTPHRAAHVAAPHDRIEILMRDLVDYANGTSHDPVTAAALAHAQFETITADLRRVPPRRRRLPLRVDAVPDRRSR
jgi:Fic family protein